MLRVIDYLAKSLKSLNVIRNDILICTVNPY